jgi:hypothetical protein
MRYLLTKAAPCWLAIALACTACGSSDLGECDQSAAMELVYSANGMVATKGQALAHDSCGNGVFCHSAAASRSERFGAPAGMNFDMLPSPQGLSDMLDFKDDAWAVVESGEMPPRGLGQEVLGDGQWSVALDGDASAPKLPALSTEHGKAAFRNWLACGAPTVTETRLPIWARPPSEPFDGGATPAFGDLYEVIFKPKCALAGCHNANGAAGGLAMPDVCGTHEALFRQGACGQRYVSAGDADGSFLMSKLEAKDLSCGDPMPPPSHGGQLPQALRDAVRDWIDAGADAEECP